MVARFLPAAHLAIDTRADQTSRDGGAEEQVIKAEPGVPPPCVPKIVPERIDALVRVQLAHGIRPTLLKQALVRLPHLRPEQRIALPTLRLVDVELRRHDV